MKRTEAGDDAASVGEPFARLRRTVVDLTDCGSKRAVHEAVVDAASDCLEFEAAVFQREGDRYRPVTRTAKFDRGDVPATLSPDEPPLAGGVGEPDGGAEPTVTEWPDGTGSECCVTPLNGDGALVLRTEPGAAVSSADLAAVSLLAGGAETALGSLEGGPTRSADVADAGVADAGVPDAGAGSSADSGSAPVCESAVEAGATPERVLDALSRAFPDYAYVLDEDGTYLDVLLGAERDEPHRRDHLTGRRVDDVLNPDAAGTVREAVRAAIDSASVQHVEYAVESGGETYRYDGRVVPVSEGAGGDERRTVEPSTVVLVARDVTERYEREQALRRENERLDEFASVVSHDLRNPLSTATGYLELVREDVDDPRLDRVAAAHDRIGTLIEDLLALAREGRHVTDADAVRLDHVAVETWQTVGSDGDLAVETDAAIRADRSRLLQVFENLFRNAVEHAGPAPSVAVGELDDGEGFFVADDGPGIEADSADAVFDPGYTSTAEGSGLGLAIVRRIAEAHGWRVDVADAESGLGGARFEFRGVEPASDA
ncbi:ATP-binding protein [Halobaculum sp. D14]|uniref:PAS domain-containing sensor histidine kinase n=1 Tax=Halobaculum sp. D14 TaxID=3421642 RepID=UPI003EC10CA5